MGALLALLSSVSWGTGDFLGGSLSRRAHPLVVMRDAQGLAFLGLIIGGPVHRRARRHRLPRLGRGGRPDRRGVARVLLRRARPAGRWAWSLRSPRPGAVVPVAVGIAEGESPTVVQVAGIAVAILGVVLASGPERSPDEAHKGHRGPLLMAGVAALGFGTALVLVAEGGEHSVVMTITTMRAGQRGGGHARHHGLRPQGGAPDEEATCPTLVAIGATDAGANGLYAIAANMSLISVTAVFALALPGGDRAPRLAGPPRAAATHPGGRGGGHAPRRRPDGGRRAR